MFQHVNGDLEKVTKQDFCDQVECIGCMYIMQASSSLNLPPDKITQGPIAVFTFESELTTGHGGFVATDGKNSLAHGLDCNLH
mmetsp:Transcript_20518/g.50342  ORF Transcript_20518/g.50342 Transcript_20518/m.50342 type:complete len:83 (+) Transcript_20518:569-817(+)